MEYKGLAVLTRQVESKAAGWGDGVIWVGGVRGGEVDRWRGGEVDR